MFYYTYFNDFVKIYDCFLSYSYEADDDVYDFKLLLLLWLSEFLFVLDDRIVYCALIINSIYLRVF